MRTQTVRFRSLLFFVLAALATLAVASPAAKLTESQKKEVAAFAMRAMGHAVSASQLKKTPSNKEATDLAATGLNLNSHLCAQVTEIRPLKVRGGYEVTCIANRGGSAKKSYVIDANTGKANAV